MREKIDFRLYLITDRRLVTCYQSTQQVECSTEHQKFWCSGSSLVTVVEEAIKAGVKAVQLREKDLPTRELLDMAYKMREITASHDATFFINDRADIAMCVAADGVHLGQLSMPAYAVRKVVGDKMMIGVSTHNLDEALTAEREGADFITFGPIYPTHSKLKYGKPVGIGALKMVSENIAIPVFGIGGIKPDNAVDVINAGAYGVALISGILGENDIKSAVEEYLRVVGQ